MFNIKACCGDTLSINCFHGKVIIAPSLYLINCLLQRSWKLHLNTCNSWEVRHQLDSIRQTNSLILRFHFVPFHHCSSFLSHFFLKSQWLHPLKLIYNSMALKFLRWCTLSTSISTCRTQVKSRKKAKLKKFLFQNLERKHKKLVFKTKRGGKFEKLNVKRLVWLLHWNIIGATNAIQFRVYVHETLLVLMADVDGNTPLFAMAL